MNFKLTTSERYVESLEMSPTEWGANYDDNKARPYGLTLVFSLDDDCENPDCTIDVWANNDADQRVIDQMIDLYKNTFIDFESMATVVFDDDSFTVEYWCIDGSIYLFQSCNGRLYFTSVDTGDCID